MTPPTSSLQEVSEFLLARYQQHGSALVYTEGKGLVRMARFLERIGNPQEKLKVIHVAGTSGKGSTAYLTSQLLGAHGFSVGLHVAPHLEDIRERMQVSGKLIEEDIFVKRFNSLLPFAEEVEREGYGYVSYFEMLVAMAFLTFAEEGAEYAVIETGVGGMYDATNSVRRPDKLAIITRIGLDHVKLLGDTLPLIAAQKAGIIQAGNRVVALAQDTQIMEPIRERAQLKGAHLIEVSPDSLTPLDRPNRYRATVANRSVEFSLGLAGAFQAENAALALIALETLSLRDAFEINPNAVTDALEGAAFPGRFERFENGTVILDSAHNPQKMEAFIGSLVKAHAPGTKFNFLLATFKPGKDASRMLDLIIPHAKSITATNFSPRNRSYAVAPEEWNALMREHGFDEHRFIDNPREAFLSAKGLDGTLAITGSLYLAGEIRHLLTGKK